MPLSPPDPSLAAEIAALDALDVHVLRVRWRRLMRRSPPPHLGSGLLRRMIAYKMQVQAHGDLPPATQRLLERLARSGVGGKTVSVPPVTSAREGRFKLGTQLVREHEGELHTLTVVESGFAWRGVTYDSLSAAAFAITGTRWNGPRFFGLRDRPKRADADAGEEGRP